MLESLDRGDAFYLMGGGPSLLAVVLDRAIGPAARATAMRIFAYINQNDARVQAISDQLGGFKILGLVVEEEGALREAAMGAVSAMVRGEYLAGKRQFIDLEGVEIVAKHLACSARCRDKGMTLLADLLLYDDRLGYLQNDTSAFCNTGSTRINHKDGYASAPGQVSHDPSKIIDN